MTTTETPSGSVEDFQAAMDEKRAAASTAREFDFYDLEYRTNPGPVFRRMQKHLPVIFSGAMNQWFFFSYDDTRAAFEDYDLFANDMVGEREGEADPNSFQENQITMIPDQVDGEMHKKYRQILNPMFRPDSFGDLEQQLEELSESLLMPFAESGSMDAMADFAVPLPTKIFCRLMGWPDEDYDRLMWWSSLYLNGTSARVASQLGSEYLDAEGRTTPAGQVRLMKQASEEIVAYLYERIEEQRGERTPGLYGALLDQRIDGERSLTDDEIVRIGFNFFLGGLDTVTHMLAAIIHRLATHESDRTRLCALMEDSPAFDTALGELIRRHSLATISRRVTRDATWRGIQLRKGDVVVLDTAVAAWDDRKFPHADELDYSRRPNPHMGFGLGLHRCLGQHLARLELKVALRTLHAMVPNYALDPDSEPEVSTGHMRGFDVLRIVATR